jgi:phytoene synthase
MDDLGRFGVTEVDVRHEVEHAGHGVQSRPVRAVLEHQAARARVYFARAVRALPANERRAVLAAEIMRGVYGELLRRIEKADYDVFSSVVRVPRGAQAAIALRTWGRIRLGRPHRS